METSTSKSNTISDLNNLNDIDEDKFVEMMGFTSFGKIRNKTKKYEKVVKETKTSFGGTKVIKPIISKISSDESEEETTKLEIEITKPEDKIPCSNEINIQNGEKLVTGIAINTAGSRMIVIGHDFNFNMYDFATTDSKYRPFRSFKPLEDISLRGAKHSPAGDLTMVYGNTSMMKLLDRDGCPMADCLRGDIYIVDKNQTKGHVGDVTSAVWNPIDLDKFISASMDSTIRTWSVEECDFGCKRVIRINGKQTRTNPCVELTYNHTGNVYYGCCMDGSLNLWDPRRASPLPVSAVPNAHVNNSPAYSLCVSRDDHTVVSRGMDDTLKLWDSRNFKLAAKTVSLPTLYNQSRAILSFDQRLIIAGAHGSKPTEDSTLNFYNITDLSIAKSIPIKNSAAIFPFWHPKLNQLFVGCSDGSVKVFFDPYLSMKGVLLGITKIHEVKTDIGESMLGEQVFNPYSKQDGLDMVNVNARKLQIRAMRDPTLTKKPEPPLYGPGQGGRVTTAMSLSAFVCKQLLPHEGPFDDSNPREAILKYAKLAEEEPYYIAPAYEKTQPVPIFHEEIPDDDDLLDIIKKKKTV